MRKYQTLNESRSAGTMTDALLEAVRGLRVAEPDLGFKPMLAKLREQQPDLGAATKEVREAMKALKAESEAAEADAVAPPAAAPAPPAADEGVPNSAAEFGTTAADEALLRPMRTLQEDLVEQVRKLVGKLRASATSGQVLLFTEEERKIARAVMPPAADESGTPNVALNLACFGCARLPSEMGDDRVKHPVCPKCRKLKVPTTYWCCVSCPGNPGAWELHHKYHKEVKKVRKMRAEGGWGSSELEQRARELAERMSRNAVQTGDKYDKLVAEGARYASEDDHRRAARAYREAIAMKPDQAALAYYNLGSVLSNSEHHVEAAQRFLEAKERCRVGSEGWAWATACAWEELRKEECWEEVAKLEWWNDEELKGAVGECS